MKKLFGLLMEWLWALEHDQRKQIATVSNTIAVLLYVQYYLKLTGFPAFVILLVTFVLWGFSVKIVKNSDGDKS